MYFQGPGRVQFGDDCQIASTRIAPTTIFTHVAESEILFGNSVRLTGMRIGCRSRIDVADGAGLAEGQIIDSDFHAVEVVDELRYRTPGRSKPIRIGANAWICAGAMVLKGVRIGENSIVGAGAVVGTSVPDNVVVFGNPARVIWRMKRAATPAANAAGAGGEAAT